jgi:hypothetical protein
VLPAVLSPFIGRVYNVRPKTDKPKERNSSSSLLNANFENNSCSTRSSTRSTERYMHPLQHEYKTPFLNISNFKSKKSSSQSTIRRKAQFSGKKNLRKKTFEKQKLKKNNEDKAILVYDVEEI